jgi:hypothetical protein
MAIIQMHGSFFLIYYIGIGHLYSVRLWTDQYCLCRFHVLKSGLDG